MTPKRMPSVSAIFIALAAAAGLLAAGTNPLLVLAATVLWLGSLWLTLPEPLVPTEPLDVKRVSRDAVSETIEPLEQPLLVLEGGRIVLANAAARSALGQHVTGQDARIALRHPEAVRLLEMADGASVTIADFTGARSLWQLTRRRIDKLRWVIELTDRSTEADVSRAHTDFVANASHELRTPLAAIIGYAETLVEDDGSLEFSTRQRFVSIIQREAKRMHNLVEDLMTLSHVEAEKRDVPSRAWDFVAAKWEQPVVSQWSFGDLPESIRVEEVGGHTVFAWPGLAVRDGEVDVRLFRKAEDAAAATPGGIRRLAEIVLTKDLVWLHRELRSLTVSSAAKNAGSFQDALTSAAPPLQAGALEHILAHTLRLAPPLTAARFTEMTAAARRDWPALISTLRAHVKTILDLRDKVLASPKRYAGMDQDAARLVPPDFLARTPHERLPHLARYLKAVLVRAERAAIHQAKDAEKARLLAPFAGWEKSVPDGNREAFRWLLEECRVSIFAQELGTAAPVSVKRLEALLSGQ